MKFLSFIKNIFKRFYKWLFKTPETKPIIPELHISPSIISMVTNTPRPDDSTRDLPVEYISVDNIPREEEELYRNLPQMEREPTAIERAIENLRIF